MAASEDRSGRDSKVTEVLLGNVPPGVTDDYLTNFLECGTDCDLREIKRPDAASDSSIVVTFSPPIDIAELQNFCSQNCLEGQTLEVKLVPQNDDVAVEKRQTDGHEVMKAEPDQSRRLECAVCMRPFTSPRLLPCFHTFCLGCLKQVLQHRPKSQGRAFNCPTCRTHTKIPPGGVEKFQVNFYIESESETSQASCKNARTCDMCRGEPATHRCSDCDQFACTTCTSVHATIAATKSHTVVHLHDIKSASSGDNAAAEVKKETYCSVHREEECRFFCNQCSQTICRDCKLTAHEDHKTINLSDRVAAAKKLVLKVTETSRRHLEPKLRRAVEQVQNQQIELQQRKMDILQTLERRANELKEEIDKSLASATEKLNQEVEEGEAIASQCIESMTQDLACFLSLTEHAQSVAQSGCDADVLEIPTQMKEFFGESEGSVSPQVPQQNACYNFPPNTSKKARKQALRAALQNVADSSSPASDCQLKSFTDSKWKVDIQLDNVQTLKQCERCAHRYDKSTDFCPSCRSPNPARRQTSMTHCGNPLHGGFGRRGAARPFPTHCRNCGAMQAQNSGSCPTCGSRESSPNVDVLATIKDAIPQYMGHVTRSSQSQASAETTSVATEDGHAPGWHALQRQNSWHAPHYSDEMNWYGGNKAPRAGRPQQLRRNVTDQITAEIKTIQLVLSVWR